MGILLWKSSALDFVLGICTFIPICAMRISQRCFLGASLAATAFAVATPIEDFRPQQRVMAGSGSAQGVQDGLEIGVGHFSEWSRETKRLFLIDWQEGRSSEWIIVQGNEGGDLDSMTAALTWAYHLQHSTQNTSNPIKAIALLQTPTDALDLRPENKIALANSQMSSGHSDLGAGQDAKPRIFEKVASCTTIVARQMLDELEKLPEEYHMPHELLELILSAVAIDAGGLKDATEEDRKTAQ